jgi:tetratricopeptide (TPR) repeat protein
MKRLILIALAVFISACATPKVENNAEAYNTRGLAHKRKGQLDQAISDYNKAIEINPRHAEAYVNRGVAYYMKGEHDYFTRLKKLQLARSAVADSNYNQAISDCTKAIEIDPRIAEAYYSRGRAWAMKDDYDEAISDYNKAIEIDPRIAEAYYSRGRAWAMKDDYDEAISDYNKAIEIDPRYAEAYYSRGRALAKKNDYDEAIVSYRKAVELKPDVAEYYLWLGNACANEELHDEAIVSYRKAVELKPNYFVALHNLHRTKIQKAKETNTGLQEAQEACEEDCKKMFEKGKRIGGITMEKCIKMLCK